MAGALDRAGRERVASRGTAEEAGPVLRRGVDLQDGSGAYALSLQKR